MVWGFSKIMFFFYIRVAPPWLNNFPGETPLLLDLFMINTGLSSHWVLKALFLRKAAN